MRTVFVNPSRKRSRRKSRRRARRPAARHYRRPVRRRRSRRRARNAGIAPFVARNPMILENPRRRRRHRNPLSLSGLNLNKFISKSVTYGSGSAIGAAVNILALRKIENDYMRNGARVVAACLAGAFMPGDMGAAAAGATLYPLFAELALAFKLVEGPVATSADLSDLSADLQDLVDEMGDGDDTEDAMF